ncbi:hypothetical protein ACFWD7_37105 [Streptomyces mirabilis]|uniref:hypothetical protein n=1 Tax=Streptomyces mirabilis TaxID=68239 RepID=UPI0036A1378B
MMRFVPCNWRDEMKLSLQFHGSRREIDAMVRGWAVGSGMTLVEECFFPVYQVRLAGGEGEDGEREGAVAVVDRISLNPAPVDLSAASAFEYVKLNPSSLFVALGEQSESIIRESVLSAMTDDVILAAVWKKFRERAKKVMAKGAWAENVMSGARSRVAGHYYTAEAKRLADSGVKPMGGTDWIRYHFD